jgi:pyruvate,water dikinase
MPDLLSFDAITDAGRVGGKGHSLARMAAAGLPVPPGFVVATDAYRRLHGPGLRSDPAFAQAVLDAYRRLGGPVAVRSSATAEDGAEASFAGQQETVLGVAGDDAVLDGIERCWASLHTDRAAAYRRQRGIPDDGLAMAVVVQALVPAEVAGVLFTRDPQDPTGRLMAVEASWGLGEAVVSGRVTPDRFRLRHDTGEVAERHPGLKAVRVTAAGEEPVPADRQTALCLSDTELSQLAELGRKVEAFYGDPRDVEWALAGGTFHLLQARPITTGSAADRERVRQEVVAELTAKADPRGTVWVRYNLSEVLPEPTPMTWGVVGRLLAADGGFGAMNRDLGAAPDPALGGESAFDLVAGRPMANLSRLPRMQFANPPVEYPFAALKADPRAALDPKPVLNPARVGFLRLPGTIWRLFRMANATRRQAETFADRFTTETAPRFAAAARQALAEDWSGRGPADLAAAFRIWVEKTLVGFARESLKPTVFAELAWQTLAEILKPRLGEEKARSAVAEVALGARPPEDADLAAAVKGLAAGTVDRAGFLERFGHRGRNEMELARPRWSEDPGGLPQAHGPRSVGVPSASLQELEAKIAALAPKPEDPRDTWERTAAEAKLRGPALATATTWADRLRTYLGLREAAKHHLLLGYAVIRKALVELDRRSGLNGGVFFLLPTELDELVAGSDLSSRIADRKRRRRVELSLEVPPVLFSDDLAAVGRPAPVPDGATTFDGVPLSAGSAEAAALVLTEPGPPPDGPYVLVCPSTDPAWVPLFVTAKGLVMETGGVLSHGAIVAREFGLPAVAGLPGITRQITTGQRIRVDGGTGRVAILSSAPTGAKTGGHCTSSAIRATFASACSMTDDSAVPISFGSVSVSPSFWTFSCPVWATLINSSTRAARLRVPSKSGTRCLSRSLSRTTSCRRLVATGPCWACHRAIGRAVGFSPAVRTNVIGIPCSSTRSDPM